MATTRNRKSNPTTTAEEAPMSKSTTTNPTEATAVVEFGSAEELLASLDSESMLPACLNSFGQEELLAAFEIVSNWSPATSVLGFADIISTYANLRSLTHEAAAEVVLGSVAALNLNDDTRIGNGTTGTSNRVCYSTGEDFDPTDPYLVFVALRPTNGNFVPGEREAMAVAFYPNTMIRFTDRNTKELVQYPDFTDTQGYAHVVRWFPSLRSAKLAKTDLQDALRTVRKVSRILRDEQYRNDPVRNVGMDDRPIRTTRVDTVSPF